jgi:hypothetical protein
MKILTWNLKHWPAMYGLPVDEDKAAIESEASTIQDIQNITANQERFQKGRAIDFGRVDKLLEIIEKLRSEGLPDIMFFQEVVSKNFIDAMVLALNKNEVVYPNVIHFNKSGLSQGLCIISKYKVEEARTIDVGGWIKKHGKKTDLSEAQKDSENLQTFISDNPVLNQTISGSEAWGHIVNNAGNISSLRPILLAKIMVEGKPVWCINIHLKSHLIMADVLSLGSGRIEHSAQIKEIGYTLNKSIREIFAYTIVGFTERTMLIEKEFENPSSFLICGDFNTTHAIGTSDMTVANENTLKILTTAGYSKVENNKPTFNDFTEAEKNVDIDHIFWKSPEKGYLNGRTVKSIKIIDINTDRVEYPTIDEGFSEDIKKGSYYVITEAASGLKYETLFLSKNPRLGVFTSGTIKTGTKVNTGGKNYIIDVSNNASVRTANFTSTDGMVLFNLDAKCKLKSLDSSGGTQGDSSRVISVKDIGASPSFTVPDIGHFEDLKGKPNKFVYKSGEWERVYYEWGNYENNKRTYWKNAKVVYKLDSGPNAGKTRIMICLESHVPSETDSMTDSAYKNRFWKDIGPVNSGFVSDHNGLLAVIE